MIIKLADSSILMDDQPVIQNFQMNVQKNASRIMCDVMDGRNQTKPLDIVAYNLNMRLAKFTQVHISVSGVERRSNVSFDLILAYEITKGTLDLQLKTDNSTIRKPIRDVGDLFRILELF